jgi:hypothetical protein
MRGRTPAVILVCGGLILMLALGYALMKKLAVLLTSELVALAAG